MRKRESEHLRSLLLHQKSVLLNKSRTYFQGEQEKESSGDEIDQAHAESLSHLLIRLQERERLLVQKIDNALARIDDGTFGYCQACGDQMNIKRLLARPVATLCIACKEDQESKERFYA